jgi:hypothetical protein
VADDPYAAMLQSYSSGGGTGGTAPAPDAVVADPYRAMLNSYVGAAKPQSSVFLSKDETSQLAAGRDRALRDLIDRPASWLAHGADYLGITSGEGARVDAMNTAGRQAYEQQYAGSDAAGAGRLGGQIALTLPIGGALSGLASGAGDIAAATPVLGRVAGPVNNLLQGSLTASTPVANAAARTVSTAAAGALQGGTAAALTSGQSDEPLAQQIARGGAVGAAVGPLATGAATAAGAAKSYLSGGAVNPEVQRLAVLARDKYGINLTADQISPSPAVQYLGSQLRHVPLSGMGPAQNALQSQFTKAIGKTLGEDVTQITPTTMQNAARRIGSGLDNVAEQTATIPGEPLVNGLAQVEHDASFLSPLQQPVVKKQVDNVLGTIGSDGTLTGKQYQMLTAFNSPLSRATRSADSDVRELAIDIRHHLDNALEASLPEGSPVLDQLRTLRMQYKNLKTIEPLVVKGEPGEISPVALQARVNQSFKGRGMRAAQPDLAELGDIGRQFNLKPDSGTGTRSAIMGGLGALGGASVSMFTDPLNALYVAGAGAGALSGGAVAGAALRSKSYINRLLSSTPAPSNPASGLLTNYAAPAASLGYGSLQRPGARRQ